MFEITCEIYGTTVKSVQPIELKSENTESALIWCEVCQKEWRNEGNKKLKHREIAQALFPVAIGIIHYSISPKWRLKVRRIFLLYCIFSFEWLKLIAEMADLIGQTWAHTCSLFTKLNLRLNGSYLFVFIFFRPKHFCWSQILKRISLYEICSFCNDQKIIGLHKENVILTKIPFRLVLKRNLIVFTKSEWLHTERRTKMANS